MSLYAIGDLHLANDPKIEDKAMDMFGGVWVDHAKKLSDIWNRIIKPEDTVLIVGDLSWALKLEDVAADIDYLRKLPGKKIIMKGNHDLWWASRKKMETLFPDVFFLQNNCYEGDDFVIAASRGWLLPNDSNFKEEEDRKIYERELLRIRASLDAAKAVQKGRHLIAATHYPPVMENGISTEITNMFTEYNVEFAVYGHLHGEVINLRRFEGTIGQTRYKLVSLDSLGACPFKLL